MRTLLAVEHIASAIDIPFAETEPLVERVFAVRSNHGDGQPQQIGMFGRPEDRIRPILRAGDGAPVGRHADLRRSKAQQLLAVRVENGASNRNGPFTAGTVAQDDADIQFLLSPGGVDQNVIGPHVGNVLDIQIAEDTEHGVLESRFVGIERFQVFVAPEHVRVPETEYDRIHARLHVRGQVEGVADESLEYRFAGLLPVAEHRQRTESAMHEKARAALREAGGQRKVLLVPVLCEGLIFCPQTVPPVGRTVEFIDRFSFPLGVFAGQIRSLVLAQRERPAVFVQPQGRPAFVEKTGIVATMDALDCLIV